jgi:hypothetical protein
MPLTERVGGRIDTMTPMQRKTFENLLRRMAKRQRLFLMKRRRRDPRSYDFNGFMIVDKNGRPVAGRDFSLSIVEAERFLLGDMNQKKPVEEEPWVHRTI